VYLNPTEKVVDKEIQKGVCLGSGDYLRIRDIATGEIRNEIGSQLFFPKLNEEVVEQLSAIPLKKNQYIRLINLRTGIITVERGEKSVLLKPDEIPYDQEVKEGVKIDEYTAVLVRDKEIGRLQLITEPQIYVPSALQEIEKIQKSILITEHETVVVRNETGQYTFREGGEQEKVFFLEPYCEIVEFAWSTGLHKDKRSLKVTHIDTRSKYMSYEFESRTKDNVELIIHVIFFWQITDVGKMVKATDDPTGDVCFHARSVAIQAVSQITLEQFLGEFNEIIRQAVVGMEKDFYEDRGVILHSVEVDSIRCMDSKAQEVLSEILQQTTLIKRQKCENEVLIQQQKGENEVKKMQILGDVEAEKLKSELVQLQNQNAQKEALLEGASEGMRIRKFLEELGEQLTLEEKILIFNVLRKQDALKILSSCNAQVYFTPPDADLRIESRVGDLKTDYIDGIVK
jgi:regulator of protease activity HflC (stomatin/prohibitin superfamily)